MKSIIRDLLEAVIVWLLVFLMTISNLISPLDYIVKDALYQRPRGVSGDIEIIGIDERTLEELGRYDYLSIRSTPGGSDMRLYKCIAGFGSYSPACIDEGKLCGAGTDDVPTGNL